MPRFTSHGEVVFESSSHGRLHHPFWGDYKQYWPGEPKPDQATNNNGTVVMQPPPPPLFSSVDEWFEKTIVHPSDFHEHMRTLQGLAAQVDTCVELSAWLKPALLSMAAGHPKKLISVCPGRKPEWDQLTQLLADKTEFLPIQMEPLSVDPLPHDLLFVDTRHTANVIMKELEHWAPHCRRWIVLHTSVTFGERGDDGNPGVLYAAQQWMDKNPDWAVKFHHLNNHGLLCLTREPTEKPDPPVPLWVIEGTRGPGTELKSLLAALGVNPSPSCDCNAKALQMDQWGVAGCKENRDRIVQGLRDNAPRWGWVDKVKAAALAVAKGIAFQLDMTDPYGSLVDLAIKRAEDAEKRSRK